MSENPVIAKMPFDKEFAAEVWGNIINSCSFRDVTLVAEKDQQKFPVHRMIVAASSEFFQSHLGPCPDSKGNNKNEFIVKNIDGPALKMIIDYCYTGHIDLTADNICATIARASSLKIASLQEKCDQFWEANLAADNCVQLVSDAEKHGLTELWNKSMAFVRENFEDIPITQLLELNAQNFRTVINHDHTSAPETYIFDVMTKWIQHNEENRAKFVGVLLECIRLKHMPTEFLSESVEPFYKNNGAIESVWMEYRRRSVQPGAVSSYRYKSIQKTKNLYGVLCAPSSENIMIYVGTFDSEFKWSSQQKDEALVKKNISIEQYGLVFLDKRLFMIGGMAADESLVKSMWSYDLITGCETRMPDLAYGRANFISIAVGDFIYVFGGRQDVDMCGYAQDTSARYHIGLNLWEQLKPFPKTSLSDFTSAIEFGGKIYVYRFKTIFTVPLGRKIPPEDYFLCYDPNWDEWTQKSCMLELDVSISIRFYFAANVVLTTFKNNIYAYAHLTDEIHLYDIQQDKWQKIGTLTNKETVNRAIEYGGEMCVVFRSKNRRGIFLGKVDPEKCLLTPLTVLSEESYTDFRLFTL